MSLNSKKQLNNLKNNNLQLIAIAIIALFANPGFGWANSFVVDPPSISWNDSNDILRDNPGPWSSLPRLGVSSNTLGLGPLDVIDAISDGLDPIDPNSRPSPIRILFSVKRTSAGAPGTAVRSERIADTAPPAPAPNGHASDIFIWYDTYGTNDLAPPPLGWALGSQSGDEANTRLRNPGPNHPGDNVSALDRSTLKFKHPLDVFDNDNPDQVPNPGAPGGIAPFPIFFSLRAGSPLLPAIGANPGDVLAVGGPFGANPKIFLTTADLGIPNTADLDSLNLQLKKAEDGTLKVHLMRFTVSSTTTGFVVADGNTVSSGATILIYDTTSTVVAHKYDELGLREEDDIDAQESVMTNEGFVGFDDSSIFIPQGDVDLVPLEDGVIQLTNIGDSGEDGVQQLFLPKIQAKHMIRSIGGQEGEEVTITPQTNLEDDVIDVELNLKRSENGYDSTLFFPSGIPTSSTGEPLPIQAIGLLNNEVIEEWEISPKKDLVINLSLGWSPSVLESGLVVSNLLLPAVQLNRSKILTQNENVTTWQLIIEYQNGDDPLTRLETGTHFDQIILIIIIPRFDDTPIAHFTGMDYNVSSMTNFEIQDLMSRYGVTSSNSTHTSLGKAQIFAGFDGGTTVSQIGDSGQDGVLIEPTSTYSLLGGENSPTSTNITLGYTEVEWTYAKSENNAPRALNFATQFESSSSKGFNDNVQEVSLVEVGDEQAELVVQWDAEYMVQSYYQFDLTGSFVSSVVSAGIIQGSFEITQTSSNSNGFEFVFGQEVRFEANNGKILKGDTFRIIRRQSVEAQRIIGIEISGENIDSFTITDVQTESPVIFKRGDFDTNGTVGIGDAINTLGYLFLGWEPSTCMDAVDANDDGKLEIVDPIHTLSYLFLGTVDIPAPGARFCGVDPTEDELNCEIYSACD